MGSKQHGTKDKSTEILPSGSACRGNILSILHYTMTNECVNPTETKSALNAVSLLRIERTLSTFNGDFTFADVTEIRWSSKTTIMPGF